MSFELSSLDGTNGFELRGALSGGQAGFSVAGGGDFNGDGLQDLLVGASRADLATANTGAVYLIYGTTAGFGASLDVSTLNGANGVRLNGVGGGSFSGSSVSFAGDVNDDGLDDILIGAPNADFNGANAGAAFLMFGTTQNLGSSFNLSSLNGTKGMRFEGTAAFDNLGTVSAAGDINGDGIDDFIVGARYANGVPGYDVGQSYVIFGKSTAFSNTLEASNLNGANGFAINGAAAYDAAGQAVASAGDLNGDGLGDLLVGTLSASGTGAYVIFGSTTPFAATLDVTALNGANGFAILAESAGDLAGYSLNTVGDVNGDGLDDIAIGAIGAAPGGMTAAGKTYIIFGNTAGFGSSFSLSSLNGVNGFAVLGAMLQDETGVSVAGGDINGDGYSDIIIGGFLADPNGIGEAGQAYVIFGTKYGFAPAIDLGNLSGWQGFALNGVATGDYAGVSVSAGDVNGDGVADIIVGATMTDPGASGDEGSTYVIFGGAATGAGVGSSGDDFLVGTPNADNLSAGAGNDLVRGLASHDTINGGGGNDTVEAADGNDSVLGGTGNDLIDAGADNDIVDGGAGNDQAFGLAGRDSLLGGDGDDTLDGGAAGDTVDGGAGLDALFGGGGNDSLIGGDGGDALTGGVGKDTLEGGALSDTLFAGVGADRLFGGTEGDRMLGGKGRDRIFGEDGDDVIDGGTRDDTIDGGLGNDSMAGSAGIDSLLGGGGNDSFVFGAASETDVIADFSAGAAVGDVIRLAGFGAAFDTFAEVMAAATDNGADTTIDFGGGAVLILQGVIVAQLNANDFTFS